MYDKAPKFDAKNFHYHNDGTGRDQYVKINNGGLLSQKMLKLLELQPKESLTKMRFPKTTNNSRSKLLLPSPHQKIQHYYGDGKGRDFFVTINDGGQVDLHKWRDHPDVLFPTQLRNYEKQYSLPDATKYLVNNEKLKSQTQVNLFRQRELTKKLSEPKLQLSPSKQSFIPDLQEGGRYQTYQQLKYQSKTSSFV
ncbi:hypothetical protein pb186bvf_015705 [Paramecium bursaria]